MWDSLVTSLETMPVFLMACGTVAFVMLLWDTIEVGRNDTANLIDAVHGARVLTRRTAVWVAGLGAVLGAAWASPVIETTRKGIFDPGMLTVEMAVAVYTAVYIVDTALLYGYSVFGMPVSTTACLVFELLGASLAIGCLNLGGSGIVNWGKAGTVVSAIIFVVVSAITFFVVSVITIRTRSRCSRRLSSFSYWRWSN